jgi:hypothetical protein
MLVQDGKRLGSQLHRASTSTQVDRQGPRVKRNRPASARMFAECGAEENTDKR